jgi:predicted GIY-YIG superfamily endonuclease
MKREYAFKRLSKKQKEKLVEEFGIEWKLY